MGQVQGKANQKIRHGESPRNYTFAITKKITSTYGYEIFSSLEANGRKELDQLIDELQTENLSERGIVVPQMAPNDFVEFIDRIGSSYPDLGGLHLFSPNLDDKNVCDALQRFIACSKLQYLQILNRNADPEDHLMWRTVAAALKTNTTITNLDLSGNYSLGHSGFAHICESLKVNTTVQVLLVNKCHISDGFRAMDQVLKVNTTLRHIFAEDNYGYELCREGLAHNTTLLTMAIGGTGAGHAMISHQQGPDEFETFVSGIIKRNRALVSD